MKKTQLLLALLAIPSAAYAFETVDSIRWPREFPAYSGDAPPVGPTEINVHAGVMRDNNILRLENNAQSDTVTRFGAGIRHTQRIVGRQSLRLEARGDYYKFDRFNEIDHFAYSALGEWLWEVGNQLSGTAGVSHSRRNIDIGEAQRAVKDMITDTRLYGTAGYMITPSFRVRGGLSYDKADRESRGDTELARTTVLAGADYVSGLGNTIGVEARRTRGDAPVPEFVAPAGTFVDNDFRETEVSIVGLYNLGATLRASGRLGKTKRDYSQIPGRDFDGTTYRAAVDWLPGAKTLLNFTVFKEPRSVLDAAATHVLTKGISFGPSWAATAKLVFSARYLREEREFQGDATTAVAGTPRRDETVRLWRFSVGWEPQRHWEVGFGLDKGERDSNFTGRNYDYTALMGNLAYRW